jgi:competence ComEA-like helix-hairpin-helix protein
MLILITVSWENLQHIYTKKRNTQTPTLSWSGTELVVVHTKDAFSDDFAIKTVPAEFKPLFFEKTPVNSADFNMLVTIPGIGPKIAEKILQHKESHGNFSAAKDMLAVKGIGKGKISVIKKYLCFENDDSRLSSD